MQLESELTLEKAVQMARQSEIVKRQVKDQHDKERGSADEVSRGARPKQSLGEYRAPKQNPTKKKQHRTPMPKGQKQCTRCNRTHIQGKCPAKGKNCLKCGKMDHFSVCCRTKTLNELAEESDYLGTIETGDGQWRAKLKVRHLLVCFKIDTGADVTVIPETVYLSLGSPKLKKTNKNLFGPGNKKLNVLGSFTETLSSQNKYSVEEIYVVRGIDRSLLGRPAIIGLNLVKLNIDEVTSVDSVKRTHPRLFRELGQLDGEYRISLNDGAKPFALAVPRRVPIPLLPKVKAELERMEKSGVIFKVDQSTDWCAGIVCVPKSDSNIRICVDLTQLNKNVRRENYPLPIIDQSLGRMAGAKYFSKLDANSGFWQINLAPESQLLTTFITPFGRFAFKRLPMGLSSSSEYFQKRMSQILEGIDGVLCQTDDILVYGRTSEEHDSRLETVLTRLEKANLTLNQDKCVFKKTQVKFVGHMVGQDGIAVDPDKVKAIRDLAPPKDVHSVRSFMGMVTQLGKFSPLLAEYSKPIRDLLSSKNQFYWGSDQQEAFDKIKCILTETPVLALYDPNRETTLMTDSSNYAIGCVVLQKQDNGEFKPVSYASRALTPTEQRYSTIEKEALGVTYGCEKHKDFLIGKSFTIVTDHKPLVPLLGQKDLSELPVRIQRFRLRLMQFSYTISHMPGKELIIPDLLSRHPTCDSLTFEDRQNCTETQMYVDLVLKSLPATDKRLQEIRSKQMSDYVCQKLIEFTQNGWPEAESCEISKLYWKFQGEITVNNGLLMRNDRLIIPSELKTDILARLHEAHQGINKCRSRAKESVWWLGISKDIENLVKGCDTCAKMQNEKREPLIATPFPDRCWSKLGSDLFHWRGCTYLLVIDYYSRYIEIAKLSSLSSATVVAHLKSILSRHGLCDTIVTDGGPQYASDTFNKFCADYGIEHITSSPRYPMGNSEAERAVQTVKRLLNACDDPYLALLTYRATPLQNGLSPSQLLFGRQIKTTLPQAPQKLDPKPVNSREIQQKEKNYRNYSKENYDRSRRAQYLPPLKQGDGVFVKDMNIEGKIIKEDSRPRSFVVETPKSIISRNRRHLIKLNKTVSFDKEIDIPFQSPVSNEQSDSQLSPNQNTSNAESSNSVVTRYGRISKPPDRLNL
ncbi:uncharacterized protein K02A2.6-like [Mercenaria mercenaria]|uniref:uncharacterized protein K02A2.6-like n=1 Tax=Mercenaria mercenaria TaxID=6596 RepID=UPI00234E8847|nr:uncharacterized protein K02A2.6-like [Mercenaria mercenaria]